MEVTRQQMEQNTRGIDRRTIEAGRLTQMCVTCQRRISNAPTVTRSEHRLSLPQDCFRPTANGFGIGACHLRPRPSLLMSFRQPDLTAGSRPILASDEALLFVQNNVGLYEGSDHVGTAERWLLTSSRKYKVSDLQIGHAYLTSHRICYVDDKDPRGNSLSLDLKDVEKYEYQVSVKPQTW